MNGTTAQNPCLSDADRIADKDNMESPPLSPARQRTIAISVFAIFALPGYVYCAFAHICMAGHMQHPPYHLLDYSSDLFSMIMFTCAAVFAVRSGMLKKTLFIVMIALLIFSRWFAGSGGGALFLLELPVCIILLVMALLSLRRPKPAVAAHAKPPTD